MMALNIDLGHDEEWAFHRQLSLTIIAKAALTAFTLLWFHPPTYGKHMETIDAKQKPSKISPSPRGNVHQRSEFAAVYSETENDSAAHEMEITNASSSLKRRRKMLTSEEKKKALEAAKAVDNNDNDNGKNRNDQQCQQQSEKKHWLGPLLPTRWSWVFFESPCCIWVILCLWDHYRELRHEPYGNASPDGASLTTATASLTANTLPVANQILLGWFFLHYCYRSLWYPLVMMKSTTKDKGMPLGIVLAAWLYCTTNGYLQARDLTKFQRIEILSWGATAELVATAISDVSSVSASPLLWQSCRFWLGMSLTLIGFCIVTMSDRTLVTLKRNRERELLERRQTPANPRDHYAIPRGGWFEYVSSPHYFGELVEWTGFFVATNGSLASLSFAVYTAANLVPRAIQTHQWYLDTFVGDDNNGNDNDRKTTEETNYSKLGRKAIIPLLL